MDWLTPAIATIASPIIAAVFVWHFARRKVREETPAVILAGVNNATKLLIDGLFQQISMLQADVVRLNGELENERRGRLKEKQDFEQTLAELLSKLDRNDPHV